MYEMIDKTVRYYSVPVVGINPVQSLALAFDEQQRTRDDVFPVCRDASGFVCTENLPQEIEVKVSDEDIKLVWDEIYSLGYPKPNESELQDSIGSASGKYLTIFDKLIQIYKTRDNEKTAFHTFVLPETADVVPQDHIHKVMFNAVLFAKKRGLSTQQIGYVALAAFAHDLYLGGNHEYESAFELGKMIASDKHGFTTDDYQAIFDCISATQIVMKDGRLQQIELDKNSVNYEIMLCVADADLLVSGGGSLRTFMDDGYNVRLENLRNKYPNLSESTNLPVDEILAELERAVSIFWEKSYPNNTNDVVRQSYPNLERNRQYLAKRYLQLTAFCHTYGISNISLRDFEHLFRTLKLPEPAQSR